VTAMAAARPSARDRRTEHPRPALSPAMAALSLPLSRRGDRSTSAPLCSLAMDGGTSSAPEGGLSLSTVVEASPSTAHVLRPTPRHADARQIERNSAAGDGGAALSEVR
jgi:hypothetical protein